MKNLSNVGVAAVVSVAAALSNGALAQECEPSRWGPDDEIGAANYVTPERVLAATKLVKEGQSHPLGIVVDPNMPAFPPRSSSMQVVQPGQHNGRDLTQDFGWPLVYNDDLAQLWFGTGPQIDGLGHLGESGVYYNCNKAVDFVHITGLKKLGIHKIPPLIGRGVMVDMAKHFGVAAMGGGEVITSEDIKAAASQQGVEFREGDVVLFHTGWTDAKLESDPTAWVSAEPGLNNEAMAYMASLKRIPASINDCKGSETDLTGGVRQCPHCDPEADFAACLSGWQSLARSGHRHQRWSAYTIPKSSQNPV